MPEGSWVPVDPDKVQASLADEQNDVFKTLEEVASDARKAVEAFAKRLNEKQEAEDA